HNQQILLDIMRNNQEIALLCELMVDFDEGMQEWRYRHVKMVERTIGNKSGTGGSSGVDYLKSTLHERIFPDLCEIRTEICPALLLNHQFNKNYVANISLELLLHKSRSPG